MLRCGILGSVTAVGLLGLTAYGDAAFGADLYAPAPSAKGVSATTRGRALSFRPLNSKVSCQFSLAHGSNICLVTGSAQCKKGKVFPFPVPPEDYRFGLLFPVPAGWNVIPGTETAEFTDYKKKAKIISEVRSPTDFWCEWSCEASLQNDAFVYGSCVAKARRT